MASRSMTSHTLPAHVARIQSPSSINTWKQCPRKYWCRYIAGLPSKPSIHLLRGTIVHEALDRFFDTDVNGLPDDPKQFFFTLKVVLNERFKRTWETEKRKLSSVGLSEEELLGYYDETKLMINNYFDYFTDKMKYFTRLLPIKEAWEAVRPSREVEFLSERHYVRGFMDAIHDEEGKTIILDYKTSRKAEITPEYELQLAIYAMLYEERHRLPDRVGIFFLKHGQELLLEVVPEMVERAKREVHEVHLGTRSRGMADYPKRPGPLCKWATGQCDYYEECFEGKPLPERFRGCEPFRKPGAEAPPRD